MSYKTKILFLTEIETFPVKGGEKIRSYGLLKMLSNINTEIIAITNSANASPKIDSIKFLHFPFDRYTKKRNFLKTNIRIFSRDHQLTKLLDVITSQNKFDIAFIDYFFYGQYINYFKKKGIKVIYGTHNAEANLYLQRKAKSLKNYFSIRVEYLIHWFHERLYFPKADLIIAVSGKDVEFYKKFIHPSKICMIPNILDKESYNLSIQQKENYIIMTANFNAFQNSYGLEWFLKEVWDSELSKRTTFKIIGIAAISNYSVLKDKYYSEKIEVLENIDDIKPYIGKAKLAIVPLLHGSGTRLKCLEAMAIKTQLLSTSKGAEGIDHKGAVLIADSPKDFKKKILEVLEGKIDTTNMAYDIFCNFYDFVPNQKIIEKEIKKLLTR